MTSQRQYFGTDGIRGRVGEWPVSADFMLRLGRAAGAVLAGADGHPRVLIGKDTRVSGYMFEAALQSGLVAAGADVQLVGPMPTPAIARLTQEEKADAGIVISASHNPHVDNGVKFFSARGEKLDDAVEEAFEDEIEAEFRTVASEHLGKASRINNADERYVAFCKSTLPDTFDLRGMTLVLDCAHGATYHVAPRVFRDLGAEVVVIGGAPDGFNINAEVGSLHPEAMQRTVVEHGADAGICFDGDGDRVVMADASGRLVDGDDIIYILARAWRADGQLRGPAVGTVMTNYGAEKALGELDIALQRARVGDRYVLQQLKQHGGNLGGETSGHVLCLDRATTGDGIVSALAVIQALVEHGETMAGALSALTKFPQHTHNVRIAEARRRLDSEAVQTTLTAVREELGDGGRVVLRPSGTEPVVRVTVEAPDTDLVQRMVQRLAEVVASDAALA